MKFPHSSFDLIDEIDRMVPERLPNVGETMTDYNRYVGKRELVIQLKHLRDESRRAAARATERKPRVRR